MAGRPIEVASPSVTASSDLSTVGVKQTRQGDERVPGKFVVKKGTTGKFRFNLLSTNGKVVATSEAYNSKASAMGGIRAVKSLAADAAVEDQTTKEWAAAEAARKAAGPLKKVAKKVVKKTPAATKKT